MSSKMALGQDIKPGRAELQEQETQGARPQNKHLGEGPRWKNLRGYIKNPGWK
jgi:hypothetical protein